MTLKKQHTSGISLFIVGMLTSLVKTAALIMSLRLLLGVCGDPCLRALLRNRPNVLQDVPPGMQVIAGGGLVRLALARPAELVSTLALHADAAPRLKRKDHLAAAGQEGSGTCTDW